MKICKKDVYLRWIIIHFLLNQMMLVTDYIQSEISDQGKTESGLTGFVCELNANNFTMIRSRRLTEVNYRYIGYAFEKMSNLDKC